MKVIFFLLMISTHVMASDSAFCGKVVKVESSFKNGEATIPFEMESVDEINLISKQSIGYTMAVYKNTVSGQGALIHQRSLLRALGDSNIEACYSENSISLRSKD